MKSKVIFVTLLCVLFVVGMVAGYLSAKESNDLDSKMNSYIYQQFKVDDYIIKYGPNCKDCPEDILKEYLKEKSILIQLISDYNNACLDLRSKNKEEDCNIIEYNHSL